MSILEDKPSQEVKEEFDKSVDEATKAIITEFEWLGLPEGIQLSDLTAQINNAIAEIMKPWL